MAFNFKSLFRKLTGKEAESVASAPAAKAATKATAVPTGQALPVIGHLSVEMQFQILGAVFLVSLLISIASIFLQNQASTRANAYLSLSGQIRPLAQQVPKAAVAALAGDAAGFRELKEARGRFTTLIERLTSGGEYEGIVVPPTTDAARPSLEKLAQVWQAQDRSIGLLLRQEDPLIMLGKVAQDAAAMAPELTAAASRSGLELQLITERVIRNAALIAWAPGFDEAMFERMAADLDAAVAKAPAGGELANGLGMVRDLWAAVLAQLPAGVKPLAAARGLAPQINRDAKGLSGAIDEVVGAYQAEASGQGTSSLLAAVTGSISLLMLVLIVKVFQEDSARRSAEAQRQQHLAETEKDMTQSAILQLMNEMGDLADGDLTVRATVTEDITGAIADSVNYTIEELAVLVRRINDAAERVTLATNSAQQTSSELIAANETQTREIEQAGAQVTEMARSMTAVSNRAQESADVARDSLGVAQKGAAAVADSIAGMNEIRTQIQDTAKRIKRLGESSQEIGEIVELISDITEQTNVLALNAAIQAASAGEAGRGFSVVAEEVQRLAERSGEATKQIAALVKTIQTDTHDAVAAMEHTTQNVVEGAKRSDAAGQSLAEISSVSEKLAGLIENISAATQDQANIAIGVADAMEGIRKITDQTTAGTQETAISVGELAALAVELKGSVSGFRV